MEPIGIGTPDVESLTSYITRLAEAHSVKVGTLIAEEIIPLLKEICPYIDLKRIDGCLKVTKKIVQILERLTLVKGLRFLTMLTWSDIFSYKAIRTNQAWCPTCYYEQQRSNQQIYRPLKWSLKYVQICLKHNTLLISKCPFCQKTVPQLSTKSKNGYCLNCNTWLGSENASLCNYENKNEQVIFINNLNKLLLQTPIMKVEPSISICRKNVNYIFDEIPFSIKDYVSRKLYHNMPFYNRFEGYGFYPSISYIINLCNILQIDLIDIYTKDIDCRKTVEDYLNYLDKDNSIEKINSCSRMDSINKLKSLFYRSYYKYISPSSLQELFCNRARKFEIAHIRIIIETLLTKHLSLGVKYANLDRIIKYIKSNEDLLKNNSKFKGLDFSTLMSSLQYIKHITDNKDSEIISENEILRISRYVLDLFGSLEYKY